MKRPKPSLVFYVHACPFKSSRQDADGQKQAKLIYIKRTPVEASRGKSGQRRGFQSLACPTGRLRLRAVRAAVTAQDFSPQANLILLNTAAAPISLHLRNSGKYRTNLLRRRKETTLDQTSHTSSPRQNRPFPHRQPRIFPARPDPRLPGSSVAGSHYSRCFCSHLLPSSSIYDV